MVCHSLFFRIRDDLHRATDSMVVLDPEADGVLASRRIAVDVQRPALCGIGHWDREVTVGVRLRVNLQGVVVELLVLTGLRCKVETE